MNLLQRIILIIKAWWNHKKEPAKELKQAEKPHPVKVFPEIAYWKSGDEITEYDSFIDWRGDLGVYQGISSAGNVIIKKYGTLSSYSLKRIKNECRNERIHNEKLNGFLSESEYMKDIDRFQELIRDEK